MPFVPADPHAPPPPPHTVEPEPARPEAEEPGLGTKSFVFTRRRRWWGPGRVPLIAAGALVVVVAAALGVLLTRGSTSSDHRRGGADSTRNVALAISFTRDEVLAYSMDLKLNGTIGYLGHTQSFDGELTGKVVMRVLRVGPQGVATLLARAVIVNGTVDGQAVHREAMRHRIRMTTTGRIVRGGSELGSVAGAFGPSGGSFGSTSQFTPVLPRGRVRPGASWNSIVDRSLAPIGSGRIHYTTHATLLRFEDINGVRSAVVHSSADVPLNFTLDLRKLLAQAGPAAGTPGLSVPSGTNASVTYTGSMSSVGDSWVGLADGQLQRMTGSMGFDVHFGLGNLPAGSTNPGAFSFTGSMNVTFDRLPATSTSAPG